MSVSAARRTKLGLVHSLAASAGLDEDARRDKLEAISGHRSAKDCTDEQLDAFIASFHVKQKANNPYTAKVKALWIACWNLGALDAGDDAALNAFVTRQTGKLRLAFLTAAEANTVSEALKAILRRHGCDVPSGDAGGLASRKMLLRAQWAKLEALGRAKVPGEFGLGGYCNAACRGAHRTSLDHFSADELDLVARRLGAVLRKTAKAPE